MTSNASERSLPAPGFALWLVSSLSTACEPWASPPGLDSRPAPAVDAARVDDLGARPINCARWRTVKEMDNFFLQRCGGENATCHANNLFGASFREPDVYRRLLSTPSLLCPGVNLADGTDHTRGALWAKIRDMPTCPAGPNSGKPAGGKMPAPVAGAPALSLTAEEKACLESYLVALTK